MLIQFAVENVLSFRDKAILSALAAPGVAHDPHHIYRTPSGLELLRVLVLYGANASGKSNVVKALDWARGLIVHGTPAGQPIPVRPFKLDPDAHKRPSRAEFEILTASGTHYAYGFVVTRERVEAEWLFRVEGDRDVTLFEREGDAIELGEAITSEAERRAFIGFVAQGTRPNQLFLHEAFDRNVEELAGAVGWFGLASVWLSGDRFGEAALRVIEDHPLMEFASRLLNQAGTGVDALVAARAFARVGDWAEHERDVAESVAGELGLEFVHVSSHSKVIRFKPSEESDGTRRLLSVAPFLYDLQSDKPITVGVIDEIDSSLHTLLTRHVVKTVLEANPDAQGQLIFTTHDTNLLDLTLLTADSVWLLEKDRGGASKLYALSEFKADQLKQLTGKVEQGYLQGRFGAIPFLGDVERLGWSKPEPEE